jgi:hypothetical protein
MTLHLQEEYLSAGCCSMHGQQALLFADVQQQGLLPPDRAAAKALRHSLHAAGLHTRFTETTYSPISGRTSPTLNDNTS